MDQPWLREFLTHLDRHHLHTWDNREFAPFLDVIPQPRIKRFRGERGLQFQIRQAVRASYPLDFCNDGGANSTVRFHRDPDEAFVVFHPVER